MRMTILLLLLAVLGIPHLQAQKNPAEKKMKAYLMVYFKDPTHSLHMALSKDGYEFTAINDGNPVVAGDTIAEQKGIRDPHIFRGPDGAFYLAMTDLHIFAKREGLRDTQWQRDGEKYGWGNNKGFVLMKSEDLINWQITQLNLMEEYPELGDIGCAWAPETTYDKETGQIMLYFTMRFKGGLNRLYYSYTNDDFNKLASKPELLFEYPKEVSYIDADITRVDGQYNMFYTSHDVTPGIKQAVSSEVNKGYQYQDEWIDPEPTSCEAPNVWKRIGEEKWVLMYDTYGINPHNFGFMETTDFEEFTPIGRFNEGVMKATNFSSPKHGAVIHLTKKEAKKLAEEWDFDF